MLDTDENVVEYLEEHFKDVRVSCEPRPDGALLVTLRNNQGKRLMSRAISGQEQSSPLLLNQVLERIRRDLIIDQGRCRRATATISASASTCSRSATATTSISLIARSWSPAASCVP